MIKIKYIDGTEENFEEADEYNVNENEVELSNDDDTIATINFNQVRSIQ